jgi:hypothetical protein
MAYVECRVVRTSRRFGTRGPAAIPVVGYYDSLHVMVYDRPFTGGDNDTLLLEHLDEQAD